MNSPQLSPHLIRSWCQWVNVNLRSGTNSVFEQIQNCYPGGFCARVLVVPFLTSCDYNKGGSSGSNTMVMLEQQANVFKNYAFYETERQLVPGNGNTIRLVDPTKWANMCPTKQVARLRAAAGLPSYFNNFNVSTFAGANLLRQKFSVKNNRFKHSSNAIILAYGISGSLGIIATRN